jgi:4-aminobutyrate aminotransferase
MTSAHVRPAQRSLARLYAYPTPLTIERGEGCDLITEGGERYLDCVAGFGVNSTGHCHPHVVASLQAQAERLLHLGAIGRRIDLEAYAERLARVAPMHDAKVFFTNSGTESVEAALKLVRYVSGRPIVVAFEGGFHGRTQGSLSVTSSKAAMRAGHEPLGGGVLTVPYPRRELAPTLQALEDLFAMRSLPDRIAAFIVEPILGEGGYQPPPPGYLRSLREICDEHGILLVVDEVQSGFARSGRMWAIEHEGVEPDLLTAAKGIASGVPMGALIGRAGLLDAWPPGAHASTFGGNPLAIAAAAATLDVIEQEQLAANAQARGQQLLAGLRHATTSDGRVVDVRGRGLMVGVEFNSPDAAAATYRDLLEQRLICGLCGPSSEVIRLSPPLIIDSVAVDRVLEAFDAALSNEHRSHD